MSPQPSRRALAGKDWACETLQNVIVEVLAASAEALFAQDKSDQMQCRGPHVVLEAVRVRCGTWPSQHKGTVPATPTCHRSKSPVSSAIIAQKMPAEPEPHTLLCGSAGNTATDHRTHTAPIQGEEHHQCSHTLADASLEPSCSSSKMQFVAPALSDMKTERPTARAYMHAGWGTQVKESWGMHDKRCVGCCQLSIMSCRTHWASPA